MNVTREIWRQHLWIVEKVGRRLTRRLPRFIAKEDLMQAGAIALRDALVRYDPTNGATLATYCGHRVRGAMIDAIRDVDHVPRYRREKARAAYRARCRLMATTGRPPSDSEIVDYLGVPAAKRAAFMRSANMPKVVSMSRVMWKTSSVRGASMLDELEMLDEVTPVFRGLSGREQRVITETVLSGKTLADVGKELGRGVPRMSQISTSAMVTMRCNVFNSRNSKGTFLGEMYRKAHRGVGTRRRDSTTVPCQPHIMARLMDSLFRGSDRVTLEDVVAVTEWASSILADSPDTMIVDDVIRGRVVIVVDDGFVVARPVSNGRDGKA